MTSLNPTRCVIKTTEENGSGVYASQFIPRNTIIEISPISLFSSDEHESHGKRSTLNHPIFKWPNGRLAVPLGLGSTFSHSEHPNTSYTLDPQTDGVRYVAARDIQPDEELCVFYGQDLWFSPVKFQGIKNKDHLNQENEHATSSLVVEVEADTWSEHPDDQEIKNPYHEGDPNEIIPQEMLPLMKLRPPPDEEDTQSIRTIKAWVFDVPDSRHIANLLKWLKQAGLDTPDLRHLKRIRKQNDLITFLVCSASCTSDGVVETPSLPPIADPKQTADQDLTFPAPYIISVPASSALTLTSLTLKSAIWPTMYTPRRKDESEPWTRGKLRWAWDAMKWTVDAAIKAVEEHQLPIAAHIPAPYDPLLQDSSDYSSTSFTALDSRKTTRNPLRHSILNVIRKVADHTTFHATEPPTANGTNYLLTDRTIFVTHEPCIMCSMALVHSRVNQLVYLYPMPKTGGCGGCACLPNLNGINHRFAILQWRLELDSPGAGLCERGIKINDDVDV